MHSVIVVVLLAGLAEQTDAQEIQGVWQLTSITIVGEVRTDVRDRAIEIEGKSLMMLQKGRQIRAKTIRLDWSKHPKHIDLTSETTQPMYGLYELEGDTLRICFYRNLKYQRNRPDSFVSDANRRTTIYTYVRRKTKQA